MKTFLDDILAHSQGEARHLSDLRKILETCRDKKLVLNRDECKFGKREVTFLGHKIRENYVGMEAEKTAVTIQLKF